jgi:pimeloyl-ACP methyl ester carboxylesterase
MADELADLAKVPGVKLPFVVVSFSASGYVPGAFAKLHPDLLGGLVFVDVAPPDEVIRLTWRQDYHRIANYERQELVSTAKALVGWFRLKHSLFPESTEEAMKVVASTSHWWATYEEGADICRSAAESEIDWSQVHVPTTVLSSMGHPDGDADARMRYWGHVRLAQQTRATFVQEPSWPHEQIMNTPIAGKVALLIADVVRRARTGAAPSPLAGGVVAGP